MKIQEKTIWWAILLLCIFLQLVRIIIPSLASRPSFVSVQFLGIGTIISIAVSASVIKSPLFGKSETSRQVNAVNLTRKQKKVLSTGYKTYYRSQKRVAVFFSLIIWAILAFLFYMDKFEIELSCLFLPISLVGPALYLRDRIKRTNN
jgi:hypothetical protein